MNVRIGVLVLAFLACAALGVGVGIATGWFGLGGVSWKEEVLLHDGSRIVVERSQSYGGRHEIGQTPPIKEQKIVFTVPGTGERVTWKSEYGEDIGRANFLALALHILNGVPYIVAEPHLCLAYNKWGRPNPPYVIFKYEGKEWHRIPVEDLPGEFKEINLVVSTKAEEKTITEQSTMSPEFIKKLNRKLKRIEYEIVLREPIEAGAEGAAVNCVEFVYGGKGNWIGLDWFASQPSYESCLRVCERKGVNAGRCPCDRIFKGK